MRVVVLGLRGFPNIQGGVETHCEHLYTRMAAQGHEVIILGREPYMGPGRKTYLGVELLAVSCPKNKFLEAFMHTLTGVFKARSLKPDIVHIHAIGPSMMVPVARFLGLKVVSTNHGPDYDRQKWNGLAKRILRFSERLGSLFSNRVIAISEPIAAHLRKAFNREPAVIPNGVVIHSPSDGEGALNKFGLEKGMYFLSVGRFVPEKGFHDLIEAFNRAQVPGWKLAIVGRADHEDSYSVNLKKLAAKNPAVVLTGFVTGEPLKELYSHAGIFMLPSYHEGLPIVLLEAMSYGLSVLVSDIPANRQVGLPEDRFFYPGDIDGAVEKMRVYSMRHFTPEERSDQIGWIAKHFDWDLIARKTLGVYERVLEEKPAQV